MAICGASVGVGCRSTSSGCPTKDGCPPGVCPDFTIRRHDTMPAFKVAVGDCDGPLDLTSEDLILEANMWAKAKLKKAISASEDDFRLADDIGFEQVMVGDIIIMDRVRLPEHMLVIAFDETNKLIQVQRGYNGTQASAWKKGASMRIFRTMNASAEIETVYENVIQEDGTTVEQLTDTLLVFSWDANTTCLPGCYWLEFKLIKMVSEEEEDVDALAISVTPSFTPSTYSAATFGCSLGIGVEWTRRFPVSGEAFLIKIEDSPTSEM